MTKHINIQKQGKNFYLHIDTNSLTIASDNDHSAYKLQCIEIELSERELEMLKEVITY